MEDSLVVSEASEIKEVSAQNNALLKFDPEITKSLLDVSIEQADIWSAPDIDKREYIRSIFAYPAMMIPAVQDLLISKVKEHQKNISSLFDPYMGGGTSLISGMYHGLDCFGQDINPLSILLSKVKTGPLLPNEFNVAALQVVKEARADKSTSIDIYFPGLTKWFNSDVALELSKLRNAIKRINCIYSRRYLWITLAEAIRLSSNDRTSTFKMHARPRHQTLDRFISPIELIEAFNVKNIEDILSFQEELKDRNYLNKNSTYTGEINIALLDSKSSIIRHPSNLKFDLLVSSPPYGDNATTITYGQFAFLPLQWIDLNDIDVDIDSKLLETISAIDNKSLGGDFKNILNADRLYNISPTLKKIVAQIKDSTKKVDNYNKVISFFSDFEASLVRIVESLNQNAYMIWTIGNRRVNKIEVPNDKILIEILKSLDCTYLTTLNRQILNKRMPTRNNITELMADEQIVIMRKN